MLAHELKGSGSGSCYLCTNHVREIYHQKAMCMRSNHPTAYRVQDFISMTRNIDLLKV